jgi:hypothetical protein
VKPFVTRWFFLPCNAYNGTDSSVDAYVVSGCEACATLPFGKAHHKISASQHHNLCEAASPRSRLTTLARNAAQSTQHQKRIVQKSKKASI